MSLVHPFLVVLCRLGGQRVTERQEEASFSLDSYEVRENSLVYFSSQVCSYSSYSHVQLMSSMQRAAMKVLNESVRTLERL